MVNISDVAKRAGVSVATVSRVINQNGYVSKETKERVQQVIEELNYTPNLIGKNFRRKKTDTVLVLMPTITNNYFSDIIGGIEGCARKYGYKLILSSTGNEVERELGFLQYALNKLADGAILIDSRTPADVLNSYLTKFPMVQCNEYRTECNAPIVTFDSFGAAQEIVNYLIKWGHRRIGLIASSIPYMASVNREKGYEKALSDNGIEYDKSLVVYCNYTFEQAKEVSRILLSRKDIDAIFCSGDIMAAAVKNAAYEMNIRIPEDISIASVDNEPISYMSAPTVTTIDLPRYQLGYETMEVFVKSCDNAEKGRDVPVQNGIRYIPHELIERASVGKK